MGQNGAEGIPDEIFTANTKEIENLGQIKNIDDYFNIIQSIKDCDHFSITKVHLCFRELFAIQEYKGMASILKK